MELELAVAGNNLARCSFSQQQLQQMRFHHLQVLPLVSTEPGSGANRDYLGGRLVNLNPVPFSTALWSETTSQESIGRTLGFAVGRQPGRCRRDLCSLTICPVQSLT